MKLQKSKGSQAFRSLLASIALALVLLAGGFLAIQQMGTTSNTREGYTRDSIQASNSDPSGIRVNSWE